MFTGNLERGRRKGGSWVPLGPLGFHVDHALAGRGSLGIYPLSPFHLLPRASPGAFIPELVTPGHRHYCGQGPDVWLCSICAKGSVDVGGWSFLGCLWTA